MRSPRLDPTIALVTGASRGAGRGIALELGAAGALGASTLAAIGRSARRGRVGPEERAREWWAVRLQSR